MILKTRKLKQNFGKQNVLASVSFEISQPGLYLFIGNNGSGKTTLFNILSNHILPDCGGIEWETENRTVPIGVSSEPFTTEPFLSVKAIAEIGRIIKKAKSSEVVKWLTFWRLTNILEKPFRTLSTGMKKRLSLALSLIGDPTFLIWDEPFNGLDPAGIELLNKLIKELLKEKKYLLISTHLLHEIKVEEATSFILKEGELHEVLAKKKMNDSTRATILERLKNAQ